MRKLHFNLVEKCLCCEAKVVEYVAKTIFCFYVLQGR